MTHLKQTHWLMLLFMWLLAGCQAETPLPTLVPSLTPTNTPHPLTPAPHHPIISSPPATLTPLPTSTSTPITPTPTSTSTPRIQPTFPLTVTAPFLEKPLTTTPCDGRGTVYRSQFPSQIAGPWRNYHVYLPPCYGQDGRTYPVLYLLPGSIQTDTHWSELGLDWHSDGGIADGRYPPFIAIMPETNPLGNNLSGGAYSIEAVIVEELIPFVNTNYCAWDAAEGRSIGGISRGGYWALMIAFRYPQLFTAVAGHSSQLRLRTDPAPYNPLASYAEADLSQMRIWLDWGETDFLRGGQQLFDQLLTEAAIPHQTTINPGGHNEAYWVAHLEEYLDWHTAVWPTDRNQYPPCPKN